MSFFSSIPYFLRLYRAEAFAVSLMACLFGSFAASGDVKIKILHSALCISFFSFNFIYSFNSWADRDIDMINSPNRPIPSGHISPDKAQVYSMVLLLISLIYPFFLNITWPVRSLFLSLPAMGILYSADPFRLKRKAIPAVLCISLGYVTPLMIGWFMAGGNEKGFPMFISLFLFGISVIPLKDITDSKGDEQGGCENFWQIWGEKLVLFTQSGLLLNFLVFLPRINPTWIKESLFLLYSAIFGTVAVFKVFKLKKTRLYRSILLVLILIGVILLLECLFAGPEFFSEAGIS